MKINLRSVLQETGSTVGYDLTEDFPAQEFGGESYAFRSPVTVKLQVTNTGKSLLVQGQIATELIVPCGRCLEDFVLPLRVDYEDEWVQSGRATEEQAENAFLFDRDEVDIASRIIEQIVLALPMKFTCTPECQGLCPTCGTNLNKGQCECAGKRVDPRLAELAKWHSGKK